MDRTSSHGAAQRAIAHVAALSAGPALGPAIALTLNFHPDRLHDGQPLPKAATISWTSRKSGTVWRASARRPDRVLYR